MLAVEPPIAKLVELATEQATGQLVARSAEGETHVYLHRGRLAWAIDSRQPHSFAGHLQSAGIPAETLREVVEECRRARLPLGETLVSWGLASADDVRRALHCQLADALSRLADDRHGHTLFLAREWSDYDAELTFTIDELGVANVATARERHEGLAKRVRAEVTGLAWVEVLAGEQVVDADPASATAHAPGELTAITLHDGADFVAVQSRDHYVLGIAIPDARSLWCRIAASSTLGSVLTAISSIAGVAERVRAPVPARAAAPGWTVGDPLGPWSSPLAAFMARAQEVAAVLVLGDDERAPPLAGSGHHVLASADCRAIALRRRPAFAPMSGDADADATAMVTGEQDWWCFGAALSPGGAHTLWLFLDRSSAQGLGWTYLHALSRTLASATGEVDR